MFQRLLRLSIDIKEDLSVGEEKAVLSGIEILLKGCVDKEGPTALSLRVRH